MPLPPVYTEDFILGGRIMIKQPKLGYRVCIDPVFLAASIQAQDTVLDVGAGVGAASLCLAARCPHLRITAVEMHKEHMRLAAENVLLNDKRHQIEVIQGDLRKPPPRLAAGSFSHVMTNPPFFNEGRLSPYENRVISHHESASLAEWVKFCILMTKPKGKVTFIYQAERLDELLVHFYGKLGNIVIFPLWSGTSAKRVLVQGSKNIQGPLILRKGLILHESNGRFTTDAENILRHAQALTWL